MHGNYNAEEPLKTDCIAGEEDIEDVLLWPLSTKEANGVSNDLRIIDPEHTSWATSVWWLRSPGENDDWTAVVFGDGRVSFTGDYVLRTYGVRPAFDLNLESVLFTSAAESGKSSGDAGAGSLERVGSNSNGEWKLTLESGHDSFKVEDVSTCDGKTVNIKYSGAVAKKGEYISAIIAGEDGAVKYYGNLIEFADGDSTQGTAKVTIDGKMESTDKLYVFNEQLNGDKKTDFSSPLQEITIPELHDWKAATCTEPKTCKECGVTDGDPLGHKYGPWAKLNATQHQKVCKATKTETIPKLKPSAPIISGTLLAKLTAKGKSSLVLSWKKVKGAEGYDVFFIKCGKDAPKKVETIEGNRTFKWTKKDLKAKKAYKAVVKAYVTKNGKKTYVRTSPMVHAYTAGGTRNCTNAKSVTVKKSSVSLKAGKTYEIKAKVSKLQEGKKLMPAGHAPKLRYISSNKKIATVSKYGKIRAKSKGSCRVYVIAVNGARKAVTVTVK